MKEWRLVELSPIIGLSEKPHWVVSRRKLNEKDVEKLMDADFSYDFDDELGICGGGRLIYGVSTKPGATRAQAEAECARLNAGGSIFDNFAWGGEEEEQ